MAQFYKGHKVWSKDEINLLKEQIEKGMEIEEIAKLHDRTVGAIYSKLEYIRCGEEYMQAEIDDIISRLKSGETLSSISKFYKRRPKEIVNKLRQLKLEELVPDSYKKVKSKKVEEKKSYDIDKVGILSDTKPKAATWIPTECNLLINKIKQGKSIEQISLDMNKSTSNIYLKLGELYYDILISKNKEEPVVIVTAKEDIYVFKMSEFVVLIKHGLDIKLKDGSSIPLKECKINISQSSQFEELLEKMNDSIGRYSTIIKALRNVERLSDIEFFIKHYSYLSSI